MDDAVKKSLRHAGVGTFLDAPPLEKQIEEKRKKIQERKKKPSPTKCEVCKCGQPIPMHDCADVP